MIDALRKMGFNYNCKILNKSSIKRHQVSRAALNDLVGDGLDECCAITLGCLKDMFEASLTGCRSVRPSEDAVLIAS